MYLACLVYENFHYIKTPEIKNEYAQEIYFYDKKKKKIEPKCKNILVAELVASINSFTYSGVSTCTF